MKYKPDWDATAERYTALWEGRLTGRPAIAVTAPAAAPVLRPDPPADPERRWMDPTWVLADARATLEGTWWGGESIPSYLLMGGWTVSLGGRPVFSRTTIWFDTAPVDFSAPSPFVVAESDVWVQRHQQLYLAAAELAGRRDFLLGRPCILPANDLLSMHMGTTEFLTALVDEPEWMRTAIVRGAEQLLAERLRLRDLIRGKHDFWYGNGGWMPFWAPQPYCPTQSDVSCMLSPEMFETFVVPELDIYGNAFGAVWYHLDGGDAQQHLPRLLSLPYLRVVQYVPTPAEPPNGPDHLSLYRQIQDAGRIVHIQVARQHVEPLLRALDPYRLLLDVRCDSIQEGQDLLDAAVRWA